MNDNYAEEPGSLKNLLEASVGVLLSKKKKIWVDAGVIGSPYSNETAISKDQLMYTRSFAAELAPYYLSGVKVSMPIGSRTHVSLYLINGWQKIEDNNSAKSFGSQVEFRSSDAMSFYWNTYIGDERSSTNPDYRMRYFTDFEWVYSPGGKFMASSCLYGGIQERENNPAANWWQANFIAKYSFSELFSLSGRLEYFHDPAGVMVVPLTGTQSFRTMSYGVCANFQLHAHALFRVEARQFSAKDNVYEDREGFASNSATWLVASLTAWF